MENTVGTIVNPLQEFGTGYGGLESVGPFLTNILRLIFVVAGVYSLINFIIAGFKYMNAAGDAKRLDSAWNLIWQSLMGLAIMVGSFALAALIGQIFFGRADFILNPEIYGPN